MPYSISLPWPSPKLSPNARVHFKRKAAIAAKYRSACRLLASQVRPAFPAEGRVPITITFHEPDRRNRDIDNMLASIKALLDGLCDSWGVNDKRFRPVTLDVGEPVKGGLVRVTIG